MTFEQLAADIAYLRASTERIEATLHERLTDHEERLRSIERCWWRLAGVIGLLAALGSTATSLAVRHLF